MIVINNYLHRTVLHNLISRWMYNEIYPSDADTVTRLINFNHIYLSRYLSQFSEKLFQKLYSSDLMQQHVSTKGDLKDALIADPPYSNQRITELIVNYRSNPGLFYYDTPFHGVLFFTQQAGANRYIGSSRIKRVRRLSEKAARRIIDHLFHTMTREADNIRDEHGQYREITFQQRTEASEELPDEFQEAESRLLQDLQKHRPIPDTEDIIINDVAGIKVILEDSQLRQLMAVLQKMPDCTVIEEEHHTGIYNATNLIVNYCPDRERIISEPISNKITTIMQDRGIHPDQLQQKFIEFVQSGEKNVVLEIIVSNYQEALESEIGRCIHEDRIIRQRLNKQYRGHLSKNIEYLLEYLFSFPASPQRELSELPIKLWNRYLPDYFDEVLKQLFHIPYDGLLDGKMD
ncbi:MAG: hypothetical protein AB2L12_17595 [Smithellaceae bacterium]